MVNKLLQAAMIMTHQSAGGGGCYKISAPGEVIVESLVLINKGCCLIISLDIQQSDVPVWVAWWGCCSLDEPWRPGWWLLRQRSVWQVRSAPWGDEGCYSPCSWIWGGDHRERTQTRVYTNTHNHTQRHSMTDDTHTNIFSHTDTETDTWQAWAL